MGLHAKLTQNLILSNILQAFNEGMVLAAKAGVDPQLMLDILDNSAARSGLIAYKAPFVFRRDFPPNFSTKWMHKDVGLALDGGRELGVPLVLTGVTQQLFQAAIAEGLRRGRYVLQYQGVRGHGRGPGGVVRTHHEVGGVDERKEKYKKLLLLKTNYSNIGIKPGRQLPPKRD